ncbi:DnaT-like ssDNA-binding domain-containing protein [Pantoea dispersa]|uniref:DnaT-like ssDNA-binding domain-containing protein n=1 Tax=Pantoea dispersa TaxID=59814 RepID=UPI00301824D0
MAGNWIKMSASLKTHPKVNEIAALLESPAEGSAGFDVSVGGQRGELLTRNVTRCVTVTALLLIWNAASEHTSDGVFRNVDLSYLDVLAEFSGFGEAMAAVGWAVYDAEEHCVILMTNNDESVVSGSKKSSAAERQRRYRQRKRAQKNVTQSVTPSITRYATNVTQPVTRDVTPGVTRYACFNYLRSKTTHKNQNNTYRAREFPSRSVDNSVSEKPQAVVAQGLRAVQGADADALTHPSQQIGHDDDVTRYVTQSVTPKHNATVTERNASAPVQRNAAGVTLRYVQQQLPPDLVYRSATTPELPENKFVMFDGWEPSATFSDTANSIGIKISAAPDRLQLADFVNYWKAENVAYYQSQWELKLARYIEKGRKHLSLKRSRERRDYTLVSEMNYEIPEGFRSG